MRTSARTLDLRIELDMPETLPAVSPLAIVVMLLLMMSVVTAYIGLVLRFALGLPVLPPRRPKVVPWGIGSVFATIVLYFAIIVAAQFTLAAATGHWPVKGQPPVEYSAGEKMTLSALINLAALFLVPVLLAATSRARLRDFAGPGDGLAKQVARGVVAYPLLAPVVFGVMILSVLAWGKQSHPLETAIVADRSPKMVAILVLAGVVLAPAAEELLFRGVLLGWLTRLAIGKKTVVAAPHALTDDDFAVQDYLDAPPDRLEPPPIEPVDVDFHNPYAAPAAPIETITRVEVEAEEEAEPSTTSARTLRLVLGNVVVSLIFAAAHATVWPTPIPIFFLSLGLGFLYQRTGTILPSMVLHMTFNGVSTLLMFLTLGTPAAKEIPKPAVKAVFTLTPSPARPIS